MTFDTARAWTETALGRKVIRIEPLKGATSSTLFRLISEAGAVVVLRLFTNNDWLALEPDLAEHEAAALEVVARCRVPSPELLAFDATGSDAGVPAVLMTEMTGAVVLDPHDRETWFDELATTLARVHEIEPADFPWDYRLWQDLESLHPPQWTGTPGIWESTIDRVRLHEPPPPASFIHRDFHPTNVLWSGGSVSGVVDWVNACRGPWQVDVAHCRLNLAAMYGGAAAGAFAARYESLTGRSYDPVWDLRQVVEWLPDAEVYPPWAELGLIGVDTPAVRSRLEQFVASALDLLG